ncbi:MAG: tetratricopeptide repeat protein [Acidobacteriia bacterium]|nr:tetratricopeptide repeat protein [Terriglobia bacterium]
MGIATTVLALLLGLNVAELRDRLLRAVGAVREPPLQIRSIAVLPLENLSGDKEQEYFADGMTDELIANLAKVGALKVISRTSVMQYKRTTKPLPQIAHELNVDAVVEGTVRRSGNRVRITAQLIHAATDRHMWAETYEGELRDVLVLQAAVARAIVGEIKVELTPLEQLRLTPTLPVKPEAYELYLEGRHHYDGFRELAKAENSYRQAIARDPTFAPAYAWLGMIYFTGGGPPGAARPAVDKALELDPALPEAHADAGIIRVLCDWDWAGAERECKRALDLGPSSAFVHAAYSWMLTAVGRFDEAIREAKRARDLDPVSPNTAIGLAIVYQKARRYDDAIGLYKRLLEHDPGYALARTELAWTYTFKGSYKEAFGEYEKLPSPPDPRKTYLYVVSGMRNEALKMIREYDGLAQKYKLGPWHEAIPYAALNDKERAFALLEQAYQTRDATMWLTKVDPWFDNIRSDPRFQDLMRRTNFPP